MAFKPRRVFTLEIAGIATLVLSVAALAVLFLSVWTQADAAPRHNVLQDTIPVFILEL
jgi:hypothetical protein